RDRDVRVRRAGRAARRRGRRGRRVRGRDGRERAAADREPPRLAAVARRERARAACSVRARMRPVAIVTDSTHYTTRELIAAAGVHEVSLYVGDGDGSRRETEITDYDAFYARLREGDALPTTSQPSIGDF